MSAASLHNLSPTGLLDPYSSPCKRRCIENSAVYGPSPDRVVTVLEVPDTVTRESKRARKMLSLCDDLEGENFCLLRSQIETNAQLTSLLKKQVLEERMQALDFTKQKKCYTVAQVILFQKTGEGIQSLGEELIQETFWSSSKEHENDQIKCVGVDKEKLRASSGKAKPYPILDHHSERACLMWLSENITQICERILAESKISQREFLWSDKNIHINMVTKFSSCRNCVLVLGQEDNFFRIPEQIVSQISSGFRVDLELSPTVTILHQGLMHHHPDSKKRSKELPNSEFYCSRSFIGKSASRSLDLLK